MQASVKGMIFLTGLATDEVPHGNGMGFVKNRPGGGQDYLPGIVFRDYCNQGFSGFEGPQGQSFQWRSGSEMARRCSFFDAEQFTKAPGFVNPRTCLVTIRQFV
jgi:hypothetical protein